MTVKTATHVVAPCNAALPPGCSPIYIIVIAMKLRRCL